MGILDKYNLSKNYGFLKKHIFGWVHICLGYTVVSLIVMYLAEKLEKLRFSEEQILLQYVCEELTEI